MIVGQQKPLESLLAAVTPWRRVLLVGCGGCTSICYAGGQREALELRAELRARAADAGRELDLGECTIERQCNADFFFPLDPLVPRYEALLSLACGAGVQFVAERYPDLPVLPALDTDFVGVDRAPGHFEENCRTCGDCVLGDTGGICPVTRCAKSLFNGPCGGTRADGHCEVDPKLPCAWFLIHERLTRQGRAALLDVVRPARNWKNQAARSVVQPAFREPHGQ